jgi:hypothetical protein
LSEHWIIVFAERYSSLFQCDPVAVLDRAESDLPFLDGLVVARLRKIKP